MSFNYREYIVESFDTSYAKSAGIQKSIKALADIESQFTWTDKTIKTISALGSMSIPQADKVKLVTNLNKYKQVLRVAQQKALDLRKADVDLNQITINLKDDLKELEDTIERYIEK